MSHTNEGLLILEVCQETPHTFLPYPLPPLLYSCLSYSTSLITIVGLWREKKWKKGGKKKENKATLTTVVTLDLLMGGWIVDCSLRFDSLSPSLSTPSAVSCLAPPPLSIHARAKQLWSFKELAAGKLKERESERERRRKEREQNELRGWPALWHWQPVALRRISRP